MLAVNAHLEEQSGAFRNVRVFQCQLDSELLVGLRLDMIGYRPDRIMKSDGMIVVFDFLILCMAF
jgi:hypothetical protein